MTKNDLYKRKIHKITSPNENRKIAPITRGKNDKILAIRTS